MNLKPVFIDQGPDSAETEFEPIPLKSTGMLLSNWMDLPDTQKFASRFVRVNLNLFYDEEFSPIRCRVAAQNMKGLLEHRRVVLLGPGVAESFDINRRDYHFFRWFDHPHDFPNSLFCVIPHPWARNEPYKDLQNVARIRDLLSGLNRLAS